MMIELEVKDSILGKPGDVQTPVHRAGRGDAVVKDFAVAVGVSGAGVDLRVLLRCSAGQPRVLG